MEKGMNLEIRKSGVEDPEPDHGSTEGRKHGNHWGRDALVAFPPRLQLALGPVRAPSYQLLAHSS